MTAAAPTFEEGLVPFTVYNMVLADGTLSIPGEILLEEHPLPQAVLRTLDASLRIPSPTCARSAS